MKCAMTECSLGNIGPDQSDGTGHYADGDSIQIIFPPGF